MDELEKTKYVDLPIETLPEYPEIDWSDNKWVVPNDLECIEPMRKELNKRFQEFHWDDLEANLLIMAFEEAVTNAIVHGNLGLKLKDKLSRRELNELVVAHSKYPENLEKKVTVLVTINEDFVEFIIRDTGKAFIPKEIDDRPEEILDTEKGNRGLILMKRIFGDGLEFQGDAEGKGNTVRLYKKKPE